MNDVDDFAEAVERSSFGTPTAKALRDQTPDEIAERIVNRAEEISDEAGSMNVDRLVEQAREVSSGHGQWDTGGANYVRSLLAGLADAVEQLQRELGHWKDHYTRAEGEIHEARARVAALEAERQAVIDAVNLYGDETLHHALDAIGFAPRVPSTGQETT